MNRRSVVLYIGTITYMANIKSARNAIKSGFRPAWAQMTVKPLDMINEMNEIK